MQRHNILGIKQDLVYKIAKRWISGKEVGEALEVAKGLNRKGMGAILNYLGEDVIERCPRQEQESGLESPRSSAQHQRE